MSGKVLLDSGEPAIGATVLLLDTELGTSADAGGEFLISRVPAGTYRLQVRLIGYEQGEPVTLTVGPGATSTVRVVMKQSAVEMSTVEVTGTRRLDASDVRSSVTTMTPRESKILPGAAEDVLRSLQALPGVTSVNDGSSQLVIRGSGPDQNLMLMDGFEVLNPYRLYGFVSMYNPETITSISLQTGGFAAQYGDRLSAVLDVRNREGRSDTYSAGKLNLSLTNMNLVFEGGLPFMGREASYILSLRRTYYDLILGPILKSAKLVEGDVALPNFRDLQAKLALPVNAEHKLLLTASTSRDGVQLVSGSERDRPDSVNIFDLSYNTLLGATWQYTPAQNVVAQTYLSWYRNDGDGLFDGTFVDPSQNTGDLGRIDTAGIRFFKFGVDYNYLYTKTSFAQRVLWNTDNHTLEAGYGADFLRTDFIRYFEVDQSFKDYLRSRGLVVPVDAVETVTYSRYSAYVQDRIALENRLFLQPGVRFDLYPVLGRRAYIAPRLNVSFKLDDLNTFRAAYGMYFQSPGMEKQDFRVRLSFDRSTFSQLRAERADHYILGYDRMLTAEWQFKAETYYKAFTDVVVPEKLSGSVWSTQPTGGNILTREGWTAPVRVAGDSLTPKPVNDASGYSYGFEFMLQKIRSAPSDRFTGWISYAYSVSDRERDGIRTAFLFDQRHAANVVGNYRLGERWDVGMRFTLRSGRPFTEALGVKPRVVTQRIDGVDVPVVQVDPDGRVVLDADYERDTFSGRLKLYHSLDVRITTYPRWWGLDWAVYLDVQNVYNHKNQQQVNYYIDDEGSLRQRAINGIPIFPSLGLSLTF